MNTGNFVPLCIATVLSIFLIIREMRWRNRIKYWRQSTGRYLGTKYFPEYQDSCPVVGYHFQDREQEQIVEFNLYSPELGEIIPIIIDPQSGRIFVNTFKDRWSLSIFFIICILLLIVLSILSN